MLSDERLRSDLRRIANNIEVDTDAHLSALLAQPSDRGRGRAPHLPGPRRRQLLVPLAAAAFMTGAVVAATTLSGTFPGVDRDSGMPAAVVLDGTPAGTVPSVFGHTRESAGILLEGLGLDVRYGKEISCDPAGRAVGTEPAAGAPVERGATVTVLLSYQGPLTDCMDDFREPWRFLDFANRRGPSPRFAAQVDLFVDGVPTGTLSAAEASRADWGAVSALGILTRATGEVLRVGDSFQLPQLHVIPGTPPDTSCGVARPRAVGDREALTLTIEFADDTARPRCPARVALYERAGAIDTVVAWSEGVSGSELRPVPDVIGLPLTEARDRVTAAGYSVRVEEQEACHPRRGVVEQAPTHQDLEEDRADTPEWAGLVTLVVEVPHTTRDCAGLDAAASAFLRFARGGPPPTWAPEVQQLFGYTPWATVSAADADDPATWSFCSGIVPEDCEASPVVVADRAGTVDTGEYSDLTRLPDQPCELIDRGGLPTDLPLDQQIVLYPAEPASCDDDWSIWLWIDDEGRITAVNLLVPTTTSEDGR